MHLRLCLINLLVLCSYSRDYYFYADVKWNNYRYYLKVRTVNEIPYNHGLRIVPALWIAQQSLNAGINLWSGSPKKKGPKAVNKFYQSNAEYVADCKAVNGQKSKDCYLHSNYDIGFCSSTPLEPIEDLSQVANLHCKNNPADDHIVSFVNKDKKRSKYINLLEDGDNIYVVLPDGTGLPDDKLALYLEKYNDAPIKQSLGELYARIKFLADLVGDEFAGIVASTDNAYYTAIIAKNLRVPNIVASVTDKHGIWPLNSAENFGAGILDTTVVLGYEDWMIVEQLAYIIIQTGWGVGSMSILHETGYSQNLANAIKNNLGDALATRAEGSLRISKDMYIHKITRWDINLPYWRRNRYGAWDVLDKARSFSRLAVLIGKEPYIRGVLEYMKWKRMWKHGQKDEFGIVIIPETGVPCGNVYQTHSKTDFTKYTAKIINIMEGAFLICHNAHNRGVKNWKWRSPKTMSSDGSDSPDTFRWKLDPPSLNTWTKYDATVGENSYNLNRRFLVREEEIDMSRWNYFERSFVSKAEKRLRTGYKFFRRRDFRVNGIAGFAHDSLIWAMFTAVLNRTNPGLFVSESGEYTLMNLFGDGSTHPTTTSNDKADMVRIGWPGMFGYENWDPFNDTHTEQYYRYLVNDGPWHDFVNRYTFKDNRPFGATPFTIKIFLNRTWHRYAGMLPHRREAERDGLPYEKRADEISDDLEYDLNGNPISTGVPMYENYKFLRYYTEEIDHVDTRETGCGYDGLKCALGSILQSIVPVAIVLLVVLSFPIADRIYFGKKRRKFEKEVNAMYWKLDPEKENIAFKAPGMGVRSSMLVSTMGAGTTLGAGTTFGMGATFGGGTMMGTEMGGTMMGTDMAASKMGATGGWETGASSGGPKQKQQVYSDIAVFASKRWAVKVLQQVANALLKNPTKEFKIEMKMLHELNHMNLLKLGGVVYIPELLVHVVLTEYCAKGSLQDVLEDSSTMLDLNFRLTFVIDIVNGMDYLHNFTTMRSHGYLKSSNIVITGSYTAKIADFGTLVRTNDAGNLAELEYIGRQIRAVWTAPEILRDEHFMGIKGTREGDVYSFGIICHEIIDGSGPFNTHDDNGIGADEVIHMVKKTKFKKPYRPVFSGIHTNEREIFVMNMARECWAEDPNNRPSFEHLRVAYVPKIEDDSMTLGQCILQQIQMMTEAKEKKIKEYDASIKAKKELFSEMQGHLMPIHVINKLTVGQSVDPKLLQTTSVLSFEITGTREFERSCQGTSLDMWKAMEQIRDTVLGLSRDHQDLYCVLASESVYVILANGSEGCPDTQATQLYTLCKELRNFIQMLELPKDVLSIRAGIDTGPAYAGIVGEKFRRYQMYGEAYRVSDIIRRQASPGMCCITESTKRRMGTVEDMDFLKLRGIQSLPNIAIYGTEI